MAALEPGNIYVIGPKAGPQKIGIAIDVEARRQALQTGSPYDLEVWFSLRMDRLASYDVEQAAHRLLRPKHLRGEWFDVTPDEARLAILSALMTASHRSQKDGIEQLETLGWVVGARKEAALAYLELRQAASGDGVATDESRGMPTAKAAGLRQQLARLDLDVKARVGARALTLLTAIAGHGVLMDRFASDHDEWENSAECLVSALDVVSDNLSRTIPA